MLKRLPPIFKNFYVMVAAGFVVWVLFFDVNDLVNQFFSLRKLQDLEEEKAFYEQKTQEVIEEREEVLSKPHLLEKFAREKYLMKKRTEEVYIIEEKK
jgi:cell division protein DivIC